MEKAAKLLDGVLNVGAVDISTDPDAASPYNVRGTPAIKFFGENKNQPLDYDGERKADLIVGYGMDQLKAIVRTRQRGN